MSHGYHLPGGPVPLTPEQWSDLHRASVECGWPQPTHFRFPPRHERERAATDEQRDT